MNRKKILIGAGIAVLLILGIYGLAPLVLDGGASASENVASQKDFADLTEPGSSEEVAEGMVPLSAGDESADALDEGDASDADGLGVDGQTGGDAAGATGTNSGSGGGGGSSGNGSGGSGNSGGSNGSGSGTSGGSGSNSGSGSDSSSARQYSCTMTINCSTILNNMDKLKASKKRLVPSNGVIMTNRTVSFTEGETVFDVLKRETASSGIHLEFMMSPVYGSAYIEGIANLYEFDCGGLSGWMYRVNGWYPNYGCSHYTLKSGDVIQWNYTCDLGRDLGAEGVVQW
jgi:hypothetical protein